MNLEAAEKLANEINQYGQALAIQCDITQSNVVEQAVQKQKLNWARSMDW